MPFTIAKRYRPTEQRLNVIPFIDILFQLIIFFALAAQFIQMENLPLSVPDDCSFAQAPAADNAPYITVTLAGDSADKASFAVDSEKIPDSNSADKIRTMTEMLNNRLENLPAEKRIVALRIDKNVPYSQAQYALAAVAASQAQNLQLAVLREKQQNNPQK